MKSILNCLSFRINRLSSKAITLAVISGLSVAGSVGIALNRTVTNQISNALTNLAPMQAAQANPASIVAQGITQQNVPKIGVDMNFVGAKDGTAWGTASVQDSPGAFLQYSVAQVGATGYLYGTYKDDRFTESYFANIVQPSPCGANKPGYKGFKSVSEITDASKLTYTTTNSILIGGKNSKCYADLLVMRKEFKGATQTSSGKYLYVVIDPVAIEGTTLKIRWWASESGNFAQAPKDF